MYVIKKMSISWLSSRKNSSSLSNPSLSNKNPEHSPKNISKASKLGFNIQQSSWCRPSFFAIILPQIIFNSHITMSSLWNLLAPTRSGIVRVAGSGNELFGTVIKHGVNNKTLTVRVSAQNYNKKYNKFIQSHKNKQVHDETNYCVTGDKVIIKCCQKLSKQKHYYVKNIVKPFPRDEHNRVTAEVEEPIITLGKDLWSYAEC